MIHFTADHDPICTIRGPSIKLRLVSVCSSGDSRSTAGTITSPNYPWNNYYNNLNCTYSVTASTVSSISFTISDLNLESGSNCRYDWVEVFIGRTLCLRIRIISSRFNSKSINNQFDAVTEKHEREMAVCCYDAVDHVTTGVCCELVRRWLNLSTSR